MEVGKIYSDRFTMTFSKGHQYVRVVYKHKEDHLYRVTLFSVSEMWDFLVEVLYSRADWISPGMIRRAKEAELVKNNRISQTNEKLVITKIDGIINSLNKHILKENALRNELHELRRDVYHHINYLTGISSATKEEE